MENKIVSGNIQDILSRGMGVGIHWFPEDFSINNVSETLVAMANSKGGLVLIGISPRANRVIGVKNPSASIDQVFQAALLAEPPLVLPLPQIEIESGNAILKVLVPGGLPNVYNVEGRYFGRKGRHNVLLSPAELRALLMERGVLQFESRIPQDASLNDLDLEKINSYMEGLRRPQDESYEDFLLQRGCLRKEDSRKKPTYAAILLFGKNPQRWLSNGIILAARFPGIDYGDEFEKQEIKGTLPEQIRQAEGFIRANIQSVVRLVGLTRIETEEFPLEAIREVLVNAVAHRDYNMGGDSIQIHMFRNRLEIHSPGTLPGPVNLSNLLEARFSRNPVIAQVLSDLGFVERLGYGLNRVVQVMKSNNLPAPKFEEIGGSFRVTLWKASQKSRNAEKEVDLSQFDSLGLNPRQELAIHHLVKKGRITNRIYQDLCPEVSSETIRRDLVDLVKSGLLIKIGDKKSTYYILKKK